MPLPQAGLLTEPEDLRTGSSVWADCQGRDRPLRSSMKADVVVVGAGVTGAFVAHALAKHGHVIVVDRRSPAAGSTSASTAMLQWEIDTPLVELGDKIGVQNARRAWIRSFRATQDLARLVHQENIRCHLEDRNSLYLAGNEAGRIKLAQEAGARRAAGLPSEYIGGADLRDRFGIVRTGAIVSTKSSVVDPVALTRGLFARAQARGVRLFFPVHITNVLATGHGVILDTGNRFIEARYCVFCTGYEFLKAVPHHDIAITSTWAIATRTDTPYPDWMDRFVVWEASQPYLYMRTTHDRRLVIGGEDESVNLAAHRTRSLPRKAKRLEQKAARLLNQRVSASRKWTGAFGESSDGLPVIDAVPDLPNCFVAMGLGGNGTIYSMIAGQIIPTLLAGKPDKDAKLYRFR